MQTTGLPWYRKAVGIAPVLNSCWKSPQRSRPENRRDCQLQYSCTQNRGRELITNKVPIAKSYLYTSSALDA